MSDHRQNEEQEAGEEAEDTQPGVNTALEPPDGDGEPGSDGEEVQPNGSGPGESSWTTGESNQTGGPWQYFWWNPHV